jgi:ankyrin repeat protein
LVSSNATFHPLFPSKTALSKSDPESAQYCGPDRWTALHHACSRRCPHPEVIDSLLRAYPEALLQTDDRGWTPLHHACRFKAPREVVRLLLRAYPELGKRAAGIRCGSGRSALYFAIRYDAPAGVVELLLQTDPTAVLDEDRDGICPLGLVWDQWANGLSGKRVLNPLLRRFEEGWDLAGTAAVGEREGSQGVDSEGIVDFRWEELAKAERTVKEAMSRSTPALLPLQDRWKVVNNLLRAYFHFPLQGDETDVDSNQRNKIESESDDEQATKQLSQRRTWRILHAVSAIKCHHTLFLLARALYPEQARELDKNDLLGGGRDVNSLPDPQSPSSEKQRMSDRTALHFAAMSPLSGKDGRNVIRILLALNPTASQHVDGYGSLPLHLLAQNDRKSHWVQDGLRDVCNAYPEATSCKDGFGRTPLHCAASSVGHYARSTTAPSSPSAAPRPPSPPHHNAAERSARDVESVIQNLVLANREAASITDNTGRLPLHFIAEHGEEWNSDAECILEAHPAASRTRARALAYNQLPLHMAASNPDARPSLIVHLVNANPRAASLFDATGRLPLHLACESGRNTWDRGIEAIYNAYSAAISMVEDSTRRWTVLHTAAASHSAGFHLVEHILSLSPENASLADGEGRYPLHLACLAGRHWEEGGVRMLFEADPSVPLTEDNDGLLPFHIVAIRSATLSATRDDEEVVGDNLNDLGEADDVDDLSSLEVLFNLLIAQPSIVQLR